MRDTKNLNNQKKKKTKTNCNKDEKEDSIITLYWNPCLIVCFPIKIWRRDLDFVLNSVP